MTDRFYVLTNEDKILEIAVGELNIMMLEISSFTAKKFTSLTKMDTPQTILEEIENEIAKNITIISEREKNIEST